MDEELSRLVLDGLIGFKCPHWINGRREIYCEFQGFVPKIIYQMMNL